MSIFELFRKKEKPMKPSEQFASENRIQLDRKAGIPSVKGLALSDFNGLLNSYSEGKVSDVENLSQLNEHKDLILKNINEELSTGNYRESVLTSNAQENAINLKSLVEILVQYYHLTTIENND